ncbi:MAG TPA: PP2C family protein-serine/threonine phosphatase [Rubricoccaceae bacterium]|jgi:sigma-B regulation protein RsbU (phosphoserine phosphatase)
MPDPTTRHALASREQELRTLFELSQAFGRALDGEAILNRLGFALMGQLFVTRVVVALREGADGLRVALARGVAAAPDVPASFADLAGPSALDAESALGRAGFTAAVPLRAGDVSRGVVLLGPRASGAPLDASGFDFAAALAALAVGALETADRVAERVAGERVAEEMRLARGIQLRLLPGVIPALPGLDVAVRWRPSRTVSGDTYDVAAVGGGRLFVAVADVVGKGLPAALLMATVQAGLRMLRPDVAAAADVGAALSTAAGRLDRLVAESTEPHQFVTLALAVVDAGAGCVWSVAAGHPAPRVVRADGTVEALEAGGPLLGVLPGASFGSASTPFRPGDTLVVFSDGLTEALRADGEEWGEAGLDAALAPGLAASDLLDGLMAASDAFATGADEADDLTAVAVRYAGPA